MFYEMLTGTVPFIGETAVDVMLKVVSEAVIPPRTRAPRARSRRGRAPHHEGPLEDPLPRHQSMEELFNELQRCYGSVRYRRSLELRRQPIPLQKMKRARRAALLEADGRRPWAPSGTSPARRRTRSRRAAAAPILLTSRRSGGDAAHGPGIETRCERPLPAAAAPAAPRSPKGAGLDQPG